MSDIALELKHSYSLANEAEISTFLDANSFLYDFLHDIYPALKNYFRLETLTLEVRHDPEENYQTLLISIHTIQDADEAGVLWERFVDEWWLDHLDVAQGKVALVLSFQ